MEEFAGRRLLKEIEWVATPADDGGNMRSMVGAVPPLGSFPVLDSLRDGGLYSVMRTGGLVY